MEKLKEVMLAIEEKDYIKLNQEIAKSNVVKEGFKKLHEDLLHTKVVEYVDDFFVGGQCIKKSYRILYWYGFYWNDQNPAIDFIMKRLMRMEFFQLIVKTDVGNGEFPDWLTETKQKGWPDQLIFRKANVNHLPSKVTPSKLKRFLE